VRAQYVVFLAGRLIPEADRGIGAAARQELAVGAGGDGGDRAGMTGKLPVDRVFGGVPTPQDVVGAAGEEPFAVGANGCREHRVGMGQEARGRRQRPKLEQSIAAARKQLWVRRMEADPRDGALM